MESNPASMTCILKLDTSPGWHQTITKLLRSVKDVSYTIDTMQGLAYVSGKIDPGSLMLMLAKSGKHAELWWVGYGYRDANDQHGQQSLVPHHSSLPVADHKLPPPAINQDNNPKRKGSNCCLM